MNTTRKARIDGDEYEALVGLIEQEIEICEHVLTDIEKQDVTLGEIEGYVRQVTDQQNAIAAWQVLRDKLRGET